MSSALDSSIGAPEADTKPFVPDKSMVTSTFEKMRAQILACAMGNTGRLVVRMVISGADGRVVEGQVVDSAFQGTSIAQCVERTVKAARFPPFQKEQLAIKYPYDL